MYFRYRGCIPNYSPNMTPDSKELPAFEYKNRLRRFKIGGEIMSTLVRLVEEL